MTPHEIDVRYANWLLSKCTKNGECLESHFKGTSNGYTKSHAVGKVHRFICDVFHGPIPEDMWALHTCDNRKCINPNHLYIGTRQDNVDDMVRRGRHKSLKPRLITGEKEIEMWKLRDEGWSYNQLAARYGVAKSTIVWYIKGFRGARPIR